MIERLIASINFWGVKFKAMESKTVQSVIMSEEVSHKFNIGIDKSKDTLKVTTQKGIIHAVHPVHRRYRVDNMQLNRNNLNVQFCTYHLMAKNKHG